MSFPNRFSFSILVLGFAATTASASGLDVQLKDLRGAFYFSSGAKSCTKLISSDIKKFGRLTHCKPSESYVECHPKGGEKLFVYEQEDACATALKTGATPAPEE